MSDLSRLQQILHDVGEQYGLLPLQDSTKALVIRHSSRVLGFFSHPNSQNLFRTSKVFRSPADFRTFTTNTHGWAWNLGGERIWIAPEITYSVRDRRDFNSTWRVPVDIDPGDYQPRVSEHAVGFFTRSTHSRNAFCHRLVVGKVELGLWRSIYPCANPIFGLTLMRDVQCFGYAQQVELECAAVQAASTVLAETWNLLQFTGGG